MYPQTVLEKPRAPPVTGRDRARLPRCGASTFSIWRVSGLVDLSWTSSCANWLRLHLYTLRGRLLYKWGLESGVSTLSPESSWTHLERPRVATPASCHGESRRPQTVRASATPWLGSIEPENRQLLDTGMAWGRVAASLGPNADGPWTGEEIACMALRGGEHPAFVPTLLASAGVGDFPGNQANRAALI